MAINKGVWYGVGMAILAGGMAITYVATKPDTSAERESIVPAQSINISTTGEVPLTFQMSSATVDICYKKQQGRLVDVDVLDPEFIAHNRSLGFQRKKIFSDGAITNVSHVALPPAFGHGYNGRRSDFPNLTQAEFELEMGGVLAANFDVDFWTKTIEFCRALGLPVDISINYNDTWAENKYRIETANPEYILFGSENVSSKVPAAHTWQQHLEWCKQTRDSINKYFPGKKLVSDASLLYRNDRKSKDWQQINPTNLTGFWGADVYWQLDDQVHYNKNEDSNIIKTKIFFDSIAPAQIAQFQSLYPTWKIYPGEVLIVDNALDNVVGGGEVLGSQVNKNIVGVYTWGRMYEMFLKNQAIQPLAVQMALRALQDSSENNTKIISRLNSLLVPTRKVTSMTFTGLEGCTGASMREGKSHWILINNSSLNTYSFPEIYVNGGRKTPTYTAIHYTSVDWYSVVQVDSTVSESYDIKPGVTILNFTLK